MSVAPPLAAHGLVFGRPGHPLGGPLDLRLAPGDALAVIGPNGAGKTTLLRTLGGLIPPLAGRVLAGGADLARLRPEARARAVAWLPQGDPAGGDLTVRELVTLGRTPHLGPFGRLTPADQAAVEAAMASADVTHLAGRALATLSGGERQRARLGLALAQGAPLLLLDEPDTHLDLRRRHELFRLLRRLRGAGLALLLVLHDLADAFREADRVLLLDGDGAAPVAAGDRALLAAAFGVPADRIPPLNPPPRAAEGEGTEGNHHARRDLGPT